MCWKAEYLILIIASTLVDYIVGLQMAQKKTKAQRRPLLVISLAVNLGLLFSFKYFNFFNESMRGALNYFNIFYDVPAFKVLLPVGISFYTFQTLSYTIDVYRGQKEPERHLGIFALYVAFFPQLVAGPIERSTRLLPQFMKRHEYDYQRITDGLKLMAWGFFKKLVIADRVGVYVNAVYNNPTDYTGMPLAIATYFFAFQIYCDFSGYSDIAIGAARVFGIDLMQNFRQPYFSRSVAEFWRRWHISLSTWFKDYLYIPLGGNRASKMRWYFNIMFVFMISGLWHGANWTFCVWGALHGLYMLLSAWTRSLRRRVKDILGISRVPALERAVEVFFTFHLVVFAWVFFRANTLSDAVYIITHLFSGFQFRFTGAQTGMAKIDGVIAVLAILLMEVVHLAQGRRGLISWLNRKPAWVRWSAYYFILFGILFMGIFGEQEFIYFQF